MEEYERVTTSEATTYGAASVFSSATIANSLAHVSTRRLTRDRISLVALCVYIPS
jgi:hypothetical protein